MPVENGRGGVTVDPSVRLFECPITGVNLKRRLEARLSSDQGIDK